MQIIICKYGSNEGLILMVVNEPICIKPLFFEDHVGPLCGRDTHTNGKRNRHNFGAIALPRSCLLQELICVDTLLVTGN